ncbi:MAG: hypothetical protein NC218_01190 [Acetobacter sp.]|nr:hypothetical protein [Acetobacter sp.]
MTLIHSKTISNYSVKICLYALWYIIVTFLAVNIYQAGLDTNTQGGRCMPDDWQIGMMYQWGWDNQPCVYTEEFLNCKRS